MFWFCRNPGLALPLIALQYHEVKVKLTTRGVVDLVNSDTPTPTSASGKKPTVNLYADYIYLDTDERRRFAQVSHEYLIEQVQRETGSMTGDKRQKLNFNHPVKELVWFCREDTYGAEGTANVDATLNVNGTTNTGENNDYFNYSGGGGGGWNNSTVAGVQALEPFSTLKLQLNGHDRFKERDSRYFTRTQVWQHHTGYGSVPTVGLTDGDLTSEAIKSYSSDAIAVYSFALKPEEHQPSGTCNFSRIDNAQIVWTGTNAADRIYAVNYNVLRIMSGMGGLAYSN